MKSADGKWTTCIQSFPDPAATRDKLHSLVNATLIALCSYFDTERWGRSRHVVSAHYQCMRCCGALEEEGGAVYSGGEGG